MTTYDIIVKPIVTEKSMVDVAKGKYGFIVAMQATKATIKKAVSDAFNVHVVSVSTIIVKGKRKRVGKRREEVNETKWKKAIVTLKKGEKISLFEAGEEAKS